MASILDLVRSASGQPDINQQIATALGQAPGQPGSPQGPQPGAGAPAAPPAAGAPPAGPGAAPQAPQQPEAYQSQPDMAQLYFKFAQQQHADDMFSRGIAGIAAGFAPSWDRNAILGMGKDTTQDPGALFGNLMKLQGWQQQQQQYKAWLSSVPDQANQLGMTQQEVMALGPDSTRTALALKVPPEQLRTYNAFKQQYVAEHAGDPDPSNPGQPLGQGGAAHQFEQLNPMNVFMASATGASVDPNDQRRQIELARWQSDPANAGKQPPDYFRDVPNFLAHGQLVQQQSADRGEAVKKFGDLNAGLNNYVTTLEGITNDPNLDKLTGNVANEGLANTAPAALGAVRGLHDRIKGLQQLSTDLQGKAAPGTQGALSGLQSGAPSLTTYATPPDDYRQNVVAPLMRQALTAQANAYGASGQTDKMPPYLRPYLDPVYAPASAGKPAGELYTGSGAWKVTPPDKTGTKKPLTEAIAKPIIEEYGPHQGIQMLKAKNYDTSSLE